MDRLHHNLAWIERGLGPSEEKYTKVKEKVIVVVWGLSYAPAQVRASVTRLCIWHISIACCHYFLGFVWSIFGCPHCDGLIGSTKDSCRQQACFISSFWVFICKCMPQCMHCTACLALILGHEALSSSPQLLNAPRLEGIVKCPPQGVRTPRITSDHLGSPRHIMPHAFQRLAKAWRPAVVFANFTFLTCPWKWRIETLSFAATLSTLQRAYPDSSHSVLKHDKFAMVSLQ